MKRKLVSLILTSALLTSLLLACRVYAHDPGIWVPEDPLHYSTLCTNDGKEIADYNFAWYINSCIVPLGFHTMIFVFEQCFSGGFINNVVKFGVNHVLPVVAMSASMFNETSWGSIAWNGEDYFVREFANAIDAYDGSNPNTAPDMWSAYSTAKANDPCGPSGTDHDDYPEHPQEQSRGILPTFPRLGNASGATSWKALLWVGKTNYRRYWNDVNHIHRVLTQKYGFDDVNDIYVMFGSGTWYGSDTLNDGGKIDSSANYDDMLRAIKFWLMGQMSNTTQLFFWSSDHGGEGEFILELGPPGMYPFDLDSSFINYMMIDTENTPSVSVQTHNVISPTNNVFLNDYLLGTLTPTGPGVRGNDTFYFDDNVVPLYSHTDNIIRFELNQPQPYEIANVTISTGGIATMTTPEPVGGTWIPVNKLALLTPYIGLASTVLVAIAATAIYVKRRKKKQ